MKNALTRFLKKRKNSHGDSYLRKPIDEIPEFLRFTKVESYIPKAAALLDIGSGDGNFLRYLNKYLQMAVGIDSHLTQPTEVGVGRLIPGYFPYSFVQNRTFDVITMMAGVEHIPMDVLPKVANACWEYLNCNRQVIITVQDPRVESFLNLLKDLAIVEESSMHEHYDFDPDCLPDIFNR